MGTRSITRVHDRDIDSNVLVAIYQQCDGYFEGVGEELQKFLDGYTIVNGIGVNTPEKAANGMGCLAAQLVKHLKNGMGGTYITSPDDTEEFMYDIFLHKGKLRLTGRGCGNIKKFKIKSDVSSWYRL